MTAYDQLLARGVARHGDRFDPGDLAAGFVRYYGTGERVRVTDGHGYTRTGTVGVTTGWRPAFLLMHRRSDVGSSDVLGTGDRVTHVRHGRTYVPVVEVAA